MTTPQAENYISDVDRTEGETKQFLEDLLSIDKEQLGGAAESELTIVSGDVTPTKAIHTIDTESDASADDLANILTTNHPDGRLLLIRAENAARTVTVKHNAGGAGQVSLTDAADVVLTTGSFLGLIRRGTDWVQLELDMGDAGIPQGQGSDIASASPLVIGTDGDYFDVTETTGFSAMTVGAGRHFFLQFDGALTITHGASIDLPGEENYPTAAGDRMICYATAANTVQVLAIHRANGRPIIEAAIAARVTRSSVQSISNATTTTINWNAEDFDTDTIHDNSTNNSRLTATTAGKYLIVFQVNWGSNNTGVRQVSIRQDGTTDLINVIFPNNGAGQDSSAISVIADLAATEYIEARVWQNSGGALDVTVFGSALSMARVGV